MRKVLRSHSQQRVIFDLLVVMLQSFDEPSTKSEKQA